MDTRQKYYIRGQLHEAYIVTERRDDSVYKTLSVGEIVCKRDALPWRPKAAQLASISTDKAPM